MSSFSFLGVYLVVGGLTKTLILPAVLIVPADCILKWFASFES